MPRDFGVSEEDRREIARLIDEGWGCARLAERYCVNRSTAKEWIHTYGAIGLDGLLNMGSKHKAYSYETKLAAARSVVDGGLSRAEAMAEFGIASSSALVRWCRSYREGDLGALRPKPKGRPPGAKNAPKEPQSELERLRAENERLRCELEVQKRLGALASAKSRAARRPR